VRNRRLVEEILEQRPQRGGQHDDQEDDGDAKVRSARANALEAAAGALRQGKLVAGASRHSAASVAPQLRNQTMLGFSCGA
jgi:hypothetical protein